MADATLTLSPEQVEFFEREGYLVLPALTTPEEVAGLCEIYDRLFATEAGRAEGDHLDLSGTDEDGAPVVLPQILNPSKYAPELAQHRLPRQRGGHRQAVAGPRGRVSRRPRHPQGGRTPRPPRPGTRTKPIGTPTRTIPS